MSRDAMTPEVLTPYLSGIRLGQPLHTFRSVTSTQDEARRLVEDSPEGTLIIAEEQTIGRGRGGKTWHSPLGMGLWLSLILRPGRPPMDWPILSSVAGLALIQALQDLFEVEANLKWPNDVWIGGRKLAGLLAESQPGAGWVILGIGVNVHQAREDMDPEIRDHATSLVQTLGSRIPSRSILLARFLRLFADMYDEFNGRGPDVFRGRLCEKEMTLGREIRLQLDNETVQGVVEDLGSRGELVLRLPDGSQKAFRTGHVELDSTEGPS
jgi:BirA family biotin operon repressor/biotin-[acetyl-CoA-carboxylase] ligase